jgi:hypothetical protein
MHKIGALQSYLVTRQGIGQTGANCDPMERGSVSQRRLSAQCIRPVTHALQGGCPQSSGCLYLLLRQVF